MTTPKAWLGIWFGRRGGLFENTIIACAPDGPAMRGGVTKGDTLTREMRAHLHDRLRLLKPGDHIDVYVVRGGKEIRCDVVVGEDSVSRAGAA
jgi:predicted metalloprotease with PDZ domain